MATESQGGDVDLDLYADVEGGEFSESVYDENHNDNGADLFEGVPSANNDFPDLSNGHGGGGGGSAMGIGGSGSGSNMKLNNLSSGEMSSHLIQNYSGKRVSFCVGNLTWWTTDQDLTEAIGSLGITDLLEIKFYENKVNGQSKGFAVVTVGSDSAFRITMDKLPKKEIHGQAPVVTYFSKHHLNQFEALARKDMPNEPNQIRGRNIPPNHGGVPGLPLTRPGGILPRPGLPPGMSQQPMGGLQGHRPPMQQVPGMQQRPQMHMQQGPPRMGGQQMGGGMPPGQSLMQRPHGPSLVPNLNGQGLIRQPPPGHRLQGPGDQRGPAPRQDWDRSGYQPGPNQMNRGIPPHGAPPVSSASAVVPAHGQGHVNPAFYSMGQPTPNGMPQQMHHPNHPVQAVSNHHVAAQMAAQQQHENPYYSRPNDRPEMFVQQLTEEEFQEAMDKNKTVSSSAISRAVTDASMGDYPAAIETLAMAISLIKQSKIANDDRCKILISSLQDTRKGIEDKYYGSGRPRSNSRDSRERPRRSRSRDSRERESRRRDKHRHRSRSRERRDYYEDARYHRSRH